MSLILKEISKTYLQGTEKLQILKNLNASIQDGELVAVVGQSGSGKSTLLSLTAGLDSPNQGQIIINSTDITKLSEKELTKFRGQNIGIVFQQFHLVDHLTALENVMLPLEIQNVSDAKIKSTELLQQVGLGSRLNHLPSQLSGGECQRVAIARALVSSPSLLLADEPSGNLDIKTGQQVMDLFIQTVKKYKITTLLVTHSEELAQKCDRRLILKDGALT